jgi:DNA-binding MarR family transcriptional regulator
MPRTTPSAAVARGFALWRAAMRWQRAIDSVLRPLGLTHTQYLVLASTARAIREQGDAVAQFAIARSAGLDCATISTLARTLETRGLLDRGIDGLDGRRWRVLVTQRGRNLLEKATPLVEAAANEAVALSKRAQPEPSARCPAPAGAGEGRGRRAPRR